MIIRQSIFLSGSRNATSATTHQARDPRKDWCAIVCFPLRCTSYRACSEQLSMDMCSVSIVATESHPLPSVMVEGSFQLQHNSLCLQDVTEASLLKRQTALQGKLNLFVATCRPGGKFPGTVGALVDVLVEFVFPSEGSVTYLSNPRLSTTHETVFSICKEFILISVQYLPHCKVICTSSAQAEWRCCLYCPFWFVSFCVSCTHSLFSADCCDIHIFQ